MADYRLFPNEKAPELKKECEDKKRQMDETVRNRRNATEDEIINDKKFKIADIGFAIVGMIIILVVPIVVCSSKCTADGGDFPAIVSSFFVMIFIGGILAVLMMIIERNMMQLREIHYNASRKQCEDYAEYIKKEKFRIEEEYRNKIVQYKKGFYEESDRRTERFAGNPITEEIAEWLGKSFINWIKASPNTEELMYRFEVTEEEVIADTCGNIDRDPERYVFLGHRVDNLADAADAMALAKSIGTSLQTEILAEFPVDPSGRPVKVNAAYGDNNHSAIGSITYLVEREDLI